MKATLYGKKCPGEGCSRTFVMSLTDKPHKDMTGICPECGLEVKLGDAKPLPEPKPTAEEAK